MFVKQTAWRQQFYMNNSVFYIENKLVPSLCVFSLLRYLVNTTLLFMWHLIELTKAHRMNKKKFQRSINKTPPTQIPA